MIPFAMCLQYFGTQELPNKVSLKFFWTCDMESTKKVSFSDYLTFKYVKGLTHARIKLKST